MRNRFVFGVVSCLLTSPLFSQAAPWTDFTTAAAWFAGPEGKVPEVSDLVPGPGVTSYSGRCFNASSKNELNGLLAIAQFENGKQTFYANTDRNKGVDFYDDWFMITDREAPKQGPFQVVTPLTTQDGSWTSFASGISTTYRLKKHAGIFLSHSVAMMDGKKTGEAYCSFDKLLNVQSSFESMQKRFDVPVEYPLFSSSTLLPKHKGTLSWRLRCYRPGNEDPTNGSLNLFRSPEGSLKALVFISPENAPDFYDKAAYTKDQLAAVTWQKDLLPVLEESGSVPELRAFNTANQTLTQIRLKRLPAQSHFQVLNIRISPKNAAEATWLCHSASLYHSDSRDTPLSVQEEIEWFRRNETVAKPPSRIRSQNGPVLTPTVPNLPIDGPPGSGIPPSGVPGGYYGPNDTRFRLQ